MKKGFTLIELIGVIVILSLITMIAVPTITAMIKNKEKKTNEIVDNTIMASANKYVIDNPRIYILEKNAVFLISVQDLITNKVLDKNILINSNKYKDKDLNKTKVKLTVVDNNQSIKLELVEE